jgi:hypothetical protein
MKKLFLATVLIISFPVLAVPSYEVTGNTEVYTEVATSKSAAYEKGIATLRMLKRLTGNQAYQKLNLFNDRMIRRSIQVDDGSVYVDEFSNLDGSLKYQAKLKIRYSYKERRLHN